MRFLVGCHIPVCKILAFTKNETPYLEALTDTPRACTHQGDLSISHCRFRTEGWAQSWLLPLFVSHTPQIAPLSEPIKQANNQQFLPCWEKMRCKRQGTGQEYFPQTNTDFRCERTHLRILSYTPHQSNCDLLSEIIYLQNKFSPISPITFVTFTLVIKLNMQVLRTR